MKLMIEALTIILMGSFEGTNANGNAAMFAEATPSDAGLPVDSIGVCIAASFLKPVFLHFANL